MADQGPRALPAEKGRGVNLEPREKLEVMVPTEKRDLADPPDLLVNPGSQAQMEHPERQEHREHQVKEDQREARDSLAWQETMAPREPVEGLGRGVQWETADR